MLDFEYRLKQAVAKASGSLYDHAIEPESVVIQPTRKEFEGTHTLVVFPFTKVAKKAPNIIAEEIGAALLESNEEIASVQVEKGFLNISFKDSVWLDALKLHLDHPSFGQHSDNKRKVMVEFSSPNTNKPLHLGHLRNIFLGDSISRIYKTAGFEVMKTNLVNDRGIHICKSMVAYQRFGEGETPESSGLKGDHLVGKYYVKYDQAYKKEVDELCSSGLEAEKAKKEAPILIEAQDMLKKWEEKDDEVVGLWSIMNGWVYDGFNETYETMGISFDKIYHESDTYLLGKDIVEEGLSKGVFFRKEDGSVWVDLTEDGLDEKLLLRADGTSVYMTQDMGTCEFKYQDFPMEKSVYVVGNEQDYHFKVLFSIMNKLGRDYSPGLHHLSYGMVDLPSGKMKSREGTVVDADELMQEMFDTAAKHTEELGKIEGLDPGEADNLYRQLGLGALKYFLLKVDPKKRMLFNPEESVEFHGNTGPFIQYTYARISAIMRRANQEQLDIEFATNQDIQPRERELIRRISVFPEIIMQAANSYSSALIAQYAYDLAKDYNGFYQEIPIFGEEDASIKKLRIAISEMTGRTIKKAMDLLGISVPNRM